MIFLLMRTTKTTYHLLGWAWITSFLTIFQLHRGGQFYWWRKQAQVTDKL